MRALCLDLDEVRGDDTSLENACQFVAESGIEAVETRVAGGRHTAHPFRQPTTIDATTLATTLRRYGLHTTIARTNLFLCPTRGSTEPTWVSPTGQRSTLDPATHLTMLDQVFRDADQLGTHAIGCHAFWREHTNTNWNQAVDLLASAATRAHRAGKLLVLHNDHRTIAGTGQELANLIHAVNSPSLTAGYDAAEAARLGAQIYPTDYHHISPTTTHLRLKHQVVDIRTGWTGGRNHSTRPEDRSRQSFGFWGTAERPVEGVVTFGSEPVVVKQARTWLTTGTAVGIHAQQWLTELTTYPGTLCLTGDFVIWGVPHHQRTHHLTTAITELTTTSRIQPN
ncbi:MAG: TIM barrel protein [Propionibacteriaceae bacterium]|nr:TIM barrel protein [Propionibacteriaceae bacterium]